MIDILYSALHDNLPLDLCHEIVKQSSIFYTNTRDAKYFVRGLLNEYRHKILRIKLDDSPDYVIYDTLSRGTCSKKYHGTIIENRIKHLSLDYLFNKYEWYFELLIRDIGDKRKTNLANIIIDTCWDVGTECSGYEELFKKKCIVQVEDGHKWRTILQAIVTDGFVTRNYQESGNQYCEPTEWQLRIA
jgi:hypothetical protein